MNELQRYLAICNGEKPDYVPIFGFNEAPGVSGGVMRYTYNVLLETGMPDVGGVWESDGCPRNLAGWRKYWGVASSEDVWEFPGEPAKGLSYEKEIKDGFEYIKCETGAVTRQVLNNSILYSMPEFLTFHVRDRKSWEFYKERRTSGRAYSQAELEDICKKYRGLDKPVRVSVTSTFGAFRDIVGPEQACMMLYDDPELAKEIFEWLQEENRKYYFPLIQKLQPDIIVISEDVCYNKGMFISPDLFREFCMPAYMEIGEVAGKSSVTTFAVDTDGFAEKIVPILMEAGVNALFPWEVKSNNNLFRVRETYPEFIIMGGLEKECLNRGNEKLIREEIMGKVPQLLKDGYYFPNGDHGIQPLVHFETMCKFMTLLHEVCENPEGEFPRMPV